MHQRFSFISLVGFLCVSFSLLFFAAQTAAAIKSVDEVTPKNQEDVFILGLSPHFGQGKGVLTRDAYLLEKSGVNSIRDDLAWRKVELKKGVYEISASMEQTIDELLSRGIEPILTIAYGNPHYQGGDYPTEPESIDAYVNAVLYIAKHFQGRVSRFQIQNEWLGQVGMRRFGKGKAEDYIELLKTTYKALKAFDPNIEVIAPSMMGHLFEQGALDRYLELGILNYTDVFSIHTYVYRHRTGRDPEAWQTWVKEMQTKLREYNDGIPVPMYITEMGWTTYVTVNGVTPQQQADYLARLFFLTRELPFLKGMWWYDFRDDGYDATINNYNFGIVRPDGTPKPAFYVMQSIASLVKKAKGCIRLDVGDPKIFVLKWDVDEPNDVWTAWSTYDDGYHEIVLKAKRDQPEPLTMQRVGRAPLQWPWGMRAWAEVRRWKERMEVPLVRDLTAISLTQTPIILRGDLSDVRVPGIRHRSFPESERPGRTVLRIPSEFLFAQPISTNESTPAFAKQLQDNPNKLEAQAWTPIKHWQVAADKSQTSEKKQTDLAAWFRPSWNPNTLQLDVIVRDDIHSQAHEPEQMWRGDGLQIGIQKLTGEKADLSAYTEIEVGLKQGQPTIHLAATQNPTFRNNFSVNNVTTTRTGDVTHYTIEIPAKALGVDELTAQTPVGLSIVVNEADGEKREGFLQWGRGIATGKNPNEYNWLILQADDTASQ